MPHAQIQWVLTLAGKAAGAPYQTMTTYTAVPIKSAAIE